MQATVAYTIFAAVLGAVAGSFLNVVVYRLPRGESLLAPGSHCTSCSTPIKPYDNVPVLGWIWLRGRCRACRAGISPRYPLVEAVTAGLCVAVVLQDSSLAAVLLGITLVLVLVPVALIDIENHIVPNRITAPAAVVAIALGCALNWAGEPERLIAGAAAGGFLLLGREVAAAMFVALIAGVVVGLVILARTPSADRRTVGVPFGPFLALGGLVGLFAGHAIVGLYLNQLH